MTSLVVSEVFGPTVQGEGPSAGRRCGFLRLGGCNLSCSWCDTAYTWDWTGTSDMAKQQGAPFNPREELERLTIPEAVERVAALDVPMLVVSGGEPLNQQAGLTETLEGWRRRTADGWVEVETNGTREPWRDMFYLVDRFTVSLKLAHSGDPEDARVVPASIEALNGPRTVWKFVAQRPGDLEEIAGMVERFGLPARNVWVMPEGQTHEDVTASLRRIADAVVAAGWNLTGRLHVQAWNDERGV